LARVNYPPALVRWLERSVAAAPRRCALDLGCGPGTLSLPLATLYRRVIGVDFSHGMLLQLRAAMASASADAVALQARAEQLPIANAGADLVACSQSLHWMRSTEVIQEVVRVLRPGGHVLLCWQEVCSDAEPIERVYLRGWSEALGSSPPESVNATAMSDVGDLLPWPPMARFRESYRRELSPSQTAEFFASRQSVGLLSDAEQERQGEFWRRALQTEIGAKIDYGFEVAAQLFQLPS
jgi:SAM-dependent methyltransferase